MFPKTGTVRCPSLLLALLIVCCITALSLAEVPHTLNYQGRLTDSAGNPLDTTVGMTFHLFNDSLMTTELWAETHSGVAITDGLFSVLLGSTTPVNASIFDGSVRWLAIEIGSDGIGQPLTPLVSTAYSLRADQSDEADYATEARHADTAAYAPRARHADTADYIVGGSSGGGGWVDDGTAVRLATVSDNVGIGTSTPSEKLHVEGNLMIREGNDLRFGTGGTLLHSTGGDLVVQTGDDIHLQPADDIYIRQGTGTTFMTIDPGGGKIGVGTIAPEEMLHLVNDASGGSAFIKIQTSHETNWHEAGLRIETPQNRWHLRMDDDTNNNLPDGALGLRSQAVNAEVMTWNEDGNVGVGTTNPLTKLHVNGTVRVNDDVLASGSVEAGAGAAVTGDIEVSNNAYVTGTVFAGVLDGALTANSVTAANIVDEPGVTSTSSSSLTEVTSSWQAITSRSITVPGPGRVIALADMDMYVDHDAIGYSKCMYGINSVPDSVPFLQQHHFQLPSSTDAGTFYMPASYHKVFTVNSAGTFQFYLLVKKYADDNSLYIYRRTFTLLYVPTAYDGGTKIDPPDQVSAGDIDMFAASREVDESGARTLEDPDTDVAQLKTQLGELINEISSLRQRLETLESK